MIFFLRLDLPPNEPLFNSFVPSPFEQRWEESIGSVAGKLCRVSVGSSGRLDGNRPKETETVLLFQHEVRSVT